MRSWMLATFGVRFGVSEKEEAATLANDRMAGEAGPNQELSLIYPLYLCISIASRRSAPSESQIGQELKPLGCQA